MNIEQIDEGQLGMESNEEEESFEKELEKYMIDN